MSDTRARRAGDHFVVENRFIRRVFLWNGGNLVSLRLERADPELGLSLAPEGGPDLQLPDEAAEAAGGELEVREFPRTPSVEAHLEAAVTIHLGELEVRRTFSVFDDAPAVTSMYAFRGRARSSSWLASSVNPANPTETRTPAARSLLARAPQLDRLPLPGRHSRLTAVELIDATDYNNNLVRLLPEVLPYRQRMTLCASLLVCREL